MDGIHFAHSAAPTLVGVSLRDTKDAAGKPFGKNIMQVIASQGPLAVLPNQFLTRSCIVECRTVASKLMPHRRKASPG